MPTLHTTRRIEFCDTDLAGIVHFANFFRFMESAEVDYLRARGLSVKMDWEGQSIGFPRVSASCDYVNAAHFEDVLDVEVTINRVGKKSVTFAFVFSRQGETIAKGEVTSVCCLVRPGHDLVGIGIPPTYRQRLLEEIGDEDDETPS